MEIIIAAIVGGVAGIITGLITTSAGRKKTDADAAQAITDAAERIAKMAMAQMTGLKKRVDDLEEELRNLRPLPDLVRKLRSGINKLIEQIRCMGQTPVWTPEMEEIVSTRKNGKDHPGV